MVGVTTVRGAASSPPAGLVGIAVIGAGRIAEQVHIPNLLRFPGVTLEGVVDPDRGRRHAIQSRWTHLPAFESIDQLLGSARPDALVVCTPPEHHVEGALRALGCGAHLYLEKPIATRSAEARGMVEAWRASTRIVSSRDSNATASPLNR